MKILIGYPPTESEKGIACLPQNRQFQWFSNPSYFFPVIMGSAATMLKKQGHEVIWKDCVTEHMGEKGFFELIEKEKPDLFAFETKTPVIKKHWETIDKLKERLPKLKIAIMRDHITYLPLETMKNSRVDYVICGGNYDFMLKDLVGSILKKRNLPKGVYYRRGNIILNTGKFELNDNLSSAPFIDRDLTKWKLYQTEYNISRRPYFYIMSGRDCWWGKCTFCVWNNTLFPVFRNRSVENVLDEIGMLIDKYGAKEIFDDSGTLTVGEWLKELCKGLIERGYNKKIRYSCNMRFGVLKQEDYNLMKKAGFRLLKFGLESANQKTLDRLDKGIKVSEVIEGSKMAKKAGLSVHLTMIVGYPWEDKEEVLRTFKLAKMLMQSGRADLLQATVLIPYPGTPLWEEGKKKNWFS